LDQQRRTSRSVAHRSGAQRSYYAAQNSNSSFFATSISQASAAAWLDPACM
jgi:hypothetical protein